MGGEGIGVGWLGPFPNGSCGVVKLPCKTKGGSTFSQGPANDPWVEPLNASAGPVLWVLVEKVGSATMLLGHLD